MVYLRFTRYNWLHIYISFYVNSKFCTLYVKHIRNTRTLTLDVLKKMILKFWNYGRVLFSIFYRFMLTCFFDCGYTYEGISSLTKLSTHKTIFKTFIRIKISLIRKFITSESDSLKIMKKRKFFCAVILRFTFSSHIPYSKKNFPPKNQKKGDILCD